MLVVRVRFRCLGDPLAVAAGRVVRRSGAWDNIAERDRMGGRTPGPHGRAGAEIFDQLAPAQRAGGEGRPVDADIGQNVRVERPNFCNHPARCEVAEDRLQHCSVDSLEAASDLGGDESVAGPAGGEIQVGRVRDAGVLARTRVLVPCHEVISIHHHVQPRAGPFSRVREVDTSDVLIR